MYCCFLKINQLILSKLCLDMQFYIVSGNYLMSPDFQT